MNSPTDPRPRQLDPLLAEAIASIRYGAVEVIIHARSYRADREAREITPRRCDRNCSWYQPELSAGGPAIHRFHALPDRTSGSALFGSHWSWSPYDETTTSSNGGVPLGGRRARLRRSAARRSSGPTTVTTTPTRCYSVACGRSSKARSTRISTTAGWRTSPTTPGSYRASGCLLVKMGPIAA